MSAMLSRRPFQCLMARGKADKSKALVRPKMCWTLRRLCKHLDVWDGQTRGKVDDCSLWMILCSRQSDTTFWHDSKDGSDNDNIMLDTLKYWLQSLAIKRAAQFWLYSRMRIRYAWWGDQIEPANSSWGKNNVWYASFLVKEGAAWRLHFWRLMIKALVYMEVNR